MAENIYSVCLIRKYNNYFNRIIKGFKTFDEYVSNIDPDDLYVYPKQINFSFEDNISTELIINDCPFAADYLLLLETNGEINSRWFVLEEVYTRNKQRKYVLRRDVVFDFKDKLLSSRAFIQKAMHMKIPCGITAFLLCLTRYIVLRTLMTLITASPAHMTV